MRGKGRACKRRNGGGGITPAYAGKSVTLMPALAAAADHPRACGEKVWILRWCGRAGGSPPRMRGKVKFETTGGGYTRITPAHAGKSQKGRAEARVRGDHPRACGEKWASANTTPACPGSPPRMRGKDRVRAMGNSKVRITPAHAGKSRPLCRAATLPEDHPRACGEKPTAPCLPTVFRGSPPRMRGKGRRSGVTQKVQRITPAHAGKSNR